MTFLAFQNFDKTHFHADFDRQAWYSNLINFGRSQEAEEVSISGDDEELIPRLVANLVVPLANHAVQVRHFIKNLLPCNKLRALGNAAM